MTKDGTPPTAKDFRAELGRWLALAQRTGHPHVDIKSGDLHRRVGGYPAPRGLHRMPTCCHVMKGEMVNEDKVICAPPSGKGATLVIRYRLPR